MDHPASQVALFGRRPRSRTLDSGIVLQDAQIWFMGASYPQAPESWPPELRDILQDRPDAGLSRYLALLTNTVDDGREDLEDELTGVQGYARSLVRRLVVPNVVREGDADHWIWQRPLLRKHPTFNLMGIHDTLVVRLCWAFQRPRIFLPASKNPTKNTHLCPDDGYLNRCVNADHYQIQHERMDPAPNPATRRGLPDGRTSKSQRWHVQNGTVVCQRADHPFSLTLQDRYRRLGEAGLHKYEHCPGCWAERLDQSGYLGRQRRGTGALSQDTAYMREIEDQAWLAVLSHEQERGQVVPPTEEPVRRFDQDQSSGLMPPGGWDDI